MKKKTLLTLCLILILPFKNISQESTSIGIAPKIVQQQIVKIPYPNEKLEYNMVSTGYIIDSSKLKSFPLPAGTPVTTIGTLPYGGNVGVFVDSILYAFGPNNTLYAINVSSASETLLGTISGIASGQIITSVAYKQPIGPLFIGSTNMSSSYLYTLNLSTLTASLVGLIINCDALAGFFMNCTGILFGVDIQLCNLLQINTQTGVGTLIGSFEYCNYPIFFSYDLSSDTLYLIMHYMYPSRFELRALTGNRLITTFPDSSITAFAIPGACYPPCEMYTGPFVSIPAQFQTGTVYPIKAKVTNYGTASQTNIPVKFFVNGIQYGVTQIIPALAPGAFDTNTIFSWTPTANGSTSLKICTALGCDTIRTDDTVSTTVTVGLMQIFCDDFSGGLSNWTITNNGGNCVWQSAAIRSETMPPTAVSPIMAADGDLCGSGTTMNTTATLTTPLNCSNYNNIYCEFDNDYEILGADHAKLDVSTDNGSTWINKFDWTTNHRTSHETQLLPEANGKASVKVRLTYVEPGWDWWWAVDNLCVKGTITGVSNGQNNVPYIYSLKQNFPNPFNPSTVISYQLPKSGNVKLVVFDVLGREVKTLVNEYKPAGTYEVTFDGSSLSSGLYFYRINTDSFTDVKKMMLVK